MIELPGFLPDEEHIDAVIDADREDEPKGEHVEEIEREVEQFHRGDHGAHRHGERGDLDQPEAPIAIEQREQGRVEKRHQRADQDELPMRPGHQIGQGEAPAGKGHRHALHRQLAVQHFLLLLRRHRLVGRDESRRQQRIVREVTIDQKPPAGCLRQLSPPIGERERTDPRRFAVDPAGRKRIRRFRG